jgi:hypothetical protein
MENETLSKLEQIIFEQYEQQNCFWGHFRNFGG